MTGATPEIFPGITRKVVPNLAGQVKKGEGTAQKRRQLIYLNNLIFIAESLHNYHYETILDNKKQSGGNTPLPHPFYCPKFFPPMSPHSTIFSEQHARMTCHTTACIAAKMSRAAAPFSREPQSSSCPLNTVSPELHTTHSLGIHTVFSLLIFSGSILNHSFRLTVACIAF